MISDILHEAIEAIEEHMAKPDFTKTYDAEMQRKIRYEVGRMRRLLERLDAPPQKGDQADA